MQSIRCVNSVFMAKWDSKPALDWASAQTFRRPRSLQCIRTGKCTVNFFENSLSAIVFGCKSAGDVYRLFSASIPKSVVLTTSTYLAQLNCQPNFFRIAYSGFPGVIWESEVFNGIVIKLPFRNAKCLMCGKNGRLVFLGVRSFVELCTAFDHVTAILHL